jgi:hypothetical protein
MSIARAAKVHTLLNVHPEKKPQAKKNRRCFFKRGSVQPGCILGDMWFRSTTIQFLNLYGVFKSMFSISFFLRNGSI